MAGIREQNRVSKEGPDCDIHQELATMCGERRWSQDAPLVCSAGRGWMGMAFFSNKVMMGRVYKDKRNLNSEGLTSQECPKARL